MLVERKLHLGRPLRYDEFVILFHSFQKKGFFSSYLSLVERPVVATEPLRVMTLLRLSPPFVDYLTKCYSEEGKFVGFACEASMLGEVRLRYLNDNTSGDLANKAAQEVVGLCETFTKNVLNFKTKLQLTDEEDFVSGFSQRMRATLPELTQIYKCLPREYRRFIPKVAEIGSNVLPSPLVKRGEPGIFYSCTDCRVEVLVTLSQDPGSLKCLLCSKEMLRQRERYALNPGDYKLLVERRGSFLECWLFDALIDYREAKTKRIKLVEGLMETLRSKHAQTMNNKEKEAIQEELNQLQRETTVLSLCDVSWFDINQVARRGRLIERGELDGVALLSGIPIIFSCERTLSKVESILTSFLQCLRLGFWKSFVLSGYILIEKRKISEPVTEILKREGLDVPAAQIVNAAEAFGVDLVISNTYDSLRKQLFKSLLTSTCELFSLEISDITLDQVVANLEQSLVPMEPPLSPQST